MKPVRKSGDVREEATRAEREWLFCVPAGRRRRSSNTTITLIDWRVVDARETPCHQAVVVELPEFVTVGAKPLASIVMPLVLETHGDAVFTKAPKLFRELVVELRRPFSLEE